VRQTLVIRPALSHEAIGVAEAHIASWRTTYAGLMPPSLIAERTDYATRVALWEGRFARPAWFVYVVEDAGKIVGFAAAAPMADSPQFDRPPLPGYDAYLEGLYLLQEYHGAGLGRALLANVAERLAAVRLNSMALHVLATNPARQFYERLGAQFIRDEALESRDGWEWHQCAYGFPQVDVLRARHA